jgi:erythromycin esterase-like protein
VGTQLPSGRRATGLAARGELNLGQLARERFGDASCAIGMATHEGEVTAAHEWDEPAALRTVRPSLPGSYERLFHDTGLGTFMLSLSSSELAYVLAGPLLERAIGVLYRPETERTSHYFSARLPEQFDLLVHVDRTRALGAAREVGSSRSRFAGNLPDRSLTCAAATR